MPIRANGQKRSAPVTGNAIKVARLATGQEDETVLYQDAIEDTTAHETGREGEVAGTARETLKRRSNITTSGASKRQA